MPEAEETAVRARLENDRRDLLDLSLRNPLLNYRPRSRGLEVRGESPAQVFEVLAREKKRMDFLPAPGETAAGPLGLPDEALPADPIVASQTDQKLQTGLASEALQSRLLAIFHAARTSLEEQGVNTLYLALGMLRWFEDGSGEKALRAPLILVPVELERTHARERFRLRFAGDELGFNLSLAAKLRSDYGLAFPELPDAEELSVVRYFDDVAEVVAGRENWVVERDSVVLAFFSFGKFLMYRDLDESLWPVAARPSAHPVVRALLREGFHEPPARFGEDDPLDEVPEAGAARLVVDADSTQMLAILDVLDGRNLVIQGPPGTGKSQTITNLIAETLGRGQTVLFVAEKMAALEVVKRRLDAAGLGDACLELHSHQTRKKAVLDALRRTLELGRPRLAPADDDLRMLGEMRGRLNEYCAAVNEPVGPSGVSPHEAYGERLRLQRELDGVDVPPFALPTVLEWTRYDFKRRRVLVEQLQGHLSALGAPNEHPFWGARRALLLPTEGVRVRALILAARDATLAVRAAGEALARSLRVAPAADRDQCRTLLRAARKAAKAAHLQGARVQSAEWVARRADLDELFQSGAALADLRAKYRDVLVPEAWEQDLLEARQDLNAAGRHWWRWFSGRYRQARRQVASLCRAEPPSETDRQIELIDAVRAARREREIVRGHDALGARLFGLRWQGERSHWPALAKLSEWVRQLQEQVRGKRLPAGLVEFLASDPDVSALPALARRAREALEAHRDASRALAHFLELNPTRREEDRPFADQEAQFDLWTRRAEELQGLVAFNHLAARCRAEELGELVAVAETWSDAGRHLVRAFLLRWFEDLLDHAFRQNQALAGFEAQSHEHVVRTFRDLDRQALRQNRARIAFEHWQRLPRHDSLGGQLGILRREMEKKARHKPLRALLKEAFNAVRAIKPVFMMSPLSVASYLHPELPPFDLVIFDEASQVKPVDALGALLRARQAVVVGDSRQLPPTSFFDRLTGQDEPDDEETSSDVESILGLFVAQGAPERMLRWHYRSRHESLIAVSNHEFYDDRLVVFPSPDSARREGGLVLRHLPGTTYDRGGTRTNPDEAEAVAQAAIAHAREQLARPAGERLTLGVAAFSVPQMEAIRQRLELLRREDPSCETFFALDGPEPFFVKNLENVQGDERDVILISVGYGRTADGFVAMAFGPLNGEGGERRLNVLMTRARVRCEVFTNLTAADIDLERTPARGVRALKTFLSYAAGGRLEVAGRNGSAPDAPFEAAVYESLRAAGCTVRAGVGEALDLAIVDPERPGRYVLGIEGDGATYRSARSARDRDRLRPQVLEALGWRLHRVWSTTWFRDPEGELHRVLNALEGPSPVTLDPSALGTESVLQREETSERAAGAHDLPGYQIAEPALKLGGLELHAVPVARLATWVRQVVATEGPVHGSEVCRRISEAAGVKRTGTRIQAALDSAVVHAIRQGTIVPRGEFLWPEGMQEPEPRDRSGLPAAGRRLDLVAPEEIARSIERVVADALGMAPEAVPLAACRLLGFGRMTDEMRVRIDAISAGLIESGRLTLQGGHLIVPGSSV